MNNVGDVIGYSIGGDSCKSDNTRICFVTTGLLLQVLASVIIYPHFKLYILKTIP